MAALLVVLGGVRLLGGDDPYDPCPAPKGASPAETALMPDGRPAGMDNEGFEAEVFFTTGSNAAGMATLRRCRGRWDVNLVLLDRSAAPGGTDPAVTRP